MAGLHPSHGPPSWKRRASALPDAQRFGEARGLHPSSTPGSPPSHGRRCMCTEISNGAPLATANMTKRCTRGGDDDDDERRSIHREALWRLWLALPQGAPPRTSGLRPSRRDEGLDRPCWVSLPGSSDVHTALRHAETVPWDVRS